MVARSGQRNRGLVVALIASLVLWQLPFSGFVLYPFKLFATWLHELSHGIVMLMTGVGFHSMALYRDTSGFAFSVRHPGTVSTAIIASAGYVGASLLGACLLVIAKTEVRARAALIGLGATLALTGVVVIQNQFGVVAVLIGAAMVTAVAVFAQGRYASSLLNFVAAQACIHAVLDIRVLFSSNLVVNGATEYVSDAHSMAAATFGTPWLWATIWLVWSFALFYGALRHTAAQDRAADAPAALTKTS